MKRPTHTFQTRFVVDKNNHKILNAYAGLFCQMERSLFSEIMAGKKANDLKNKYLKRFDVTARQFNACRAQLEGKINSLKQLQSREILNVKERIKKLERTISHKKKKKYSFLFFKQCSLKKLTDKLGKLEKKKAEGKVDLCFGSKKCFRAQFHLEDSSYNSFSEWKEDWKNSRNTHFFILGSKDESGGNQSCTVSIQKSGKLSCRLRLPNALVEKYGKYLVFSDVSFQYGHEAIVSSIESCQTRSNLQKTGNNLYKEFGQAISFRIKQDKKGWRVFATTTLEEPEWITKSTLGVIGIDVNANHLAIAETDHFGNVIKTSSIPLSLYGKSKDQSKAIIGDSCAKIIDLAIAKRKDCVIEKLDFQKKKQSLSENQNISYKRMISSFAYESIIGNFKSRAWRFGVHVHEVNPAYTSVIGQVKFAYRYGMSTHQAAALSIARRYFRFSEKVPRQMEKIPDGKGDHVDFPVPVRNRKKHVWSQWGIIRRKLRVVLAAHFRAIRNRSIDPPLTVYEIVTSRI